MRVLPLAAVLIASICSSAMAGPREDALAVLAKWTQAFAASDVDGIVKLYAPDALFLGTGSKSVADKPAEIRKYFEQTFRAISSRSAKLGEHAAMVLSDSTVVVTGVDTVAGVRDGKPFSAGGRVTFVLEKQGADWQIVHFHRSAMPN